MNTATDLTRNAAPQPLLSKAARIATAAAVAGFVAFAWASAGQASHQAVQATTAELTGRTYVTLPAVEIVGRRAPVARTATTASPTQAL